MAQFHIGQRVRIVACDPGCERAVGLEGAVMSKEFVSKKFGPRQLVMVKLDAETVATAEPVAYLAPLTDPRADEFIADMERFAHVAKTTKVTA